MSSSDEINFNERNEYVYYKIIYDTRMSWSGAVVTYFNSNEKIPSSNLGFS